MSYNELLQHGTPEFPVALYHIDKNHPRYEMPYHWHKHLEICRVLEGEINLRLNNREFILKKGDIIITNPETVHGGSPSCDSVYECLVFNIEMLSSGGDSCRFFVDSLLNHKYKITEFTDNWNEEFKKVCDSLFFAMNHPSSGYKFKVTGLIYEFFGIIIDNHWYRDIANSDIAKDKKIPKLKKILSYIEDNYSENITLKDMAEIAGMSSKYFCHFFKEMTTRSPVEYLKSYRIEMAAKELLTSDLSITEIAYNTGFNDLSYFIKTFKNQMGVTPYKYRND